MKRAYEAPRSRPRARNHLGIPAGMSERAFIGSFGKTKEKLYVLIRQSRMRPHFPPRGYCGDDIPDKLSERFIRPGVKMYVVSVLPHDLRTGKRIGLREGSPEELNIILEVALLGRHLEIGDQVFNGS
jgi:hypothetical protein